MGVCGGMGGAGCGVSAAERRGDGQFPVPRLPVFSPPHRRRPRRRMRLCVGNFLRGFFLLLCFCCVANTPVAAATEEGEGRGRMKGHETRSRPPKGTRNKKNESIQRTGSGCCGFAYFLLLAASSYSSSPLLFSSFLPRSSLVSDPPNPQQQISKQHRDQQKEKQTPSTHPSQSGNCHLKGALSDAAWLRRELAGVSASSSRAPGATVI